MGKGQIAPYEQFLLFPQCFQKACFPGASKGVIVWEWVKRRHNFRQLQIEGICRQKKKGYLQRLMPFAFDRMGNVIGKRGKCWLPAFSPIPTMSFKQFFFTGLLN